MSGEHGEMVIDTSFDFRTDAGGGDPDVASPTLRRYHKFLWSKPLPGGTPFELDDTTPGAYLHHRSGLGEFFLSSDAVMPTFSHWVKLKHIIDQLPEAEIESFKTIGYTIGAMMIFPGNRINGQLTINGARGFTRSIADRMDLTLECIRRYYLGQDSPLSATLERYADFFALFEDFSGYVAFFLLDDLVEEDRTAVRFFMPFDDFAPPHTPQDVDTYREYRRRSIEFIKARNRRIDAWQAGRSARVSRAHGEP